MGFLWDLLQQSQISDQREKAEDLELRVERLEKELIQTRQIVKQLLEFLDEQYQ